MTKIITAYLVEVERRTIRAVAIDPENSLVDIRRYIGCRLIDMVRVDRDHSIIVDDEGLKDELACFTDLQNYDSPLAGNLLIIGTGRFGDTVSARRPIEDFADMLTIRYPVLSPEFEVLNGPNVFGRRLAGFSVKLKSVTPTVISAGAAH